ncbi:MAG TPA: ComEA family DNA-binding protein [Actinomycetota bacterium]|nr:ComEA family DNA-binding protein [Actinomycetota bacterium]
MSEPSLRERLASLSRAELGGLALLIVAALAGGGLWYVRSLPRPVEVRAAVAEPPPSATASPSASPVLVHVAGWVHRPGVYELEPGDRVVDAIRAAGGARRGANLDALNLAAPLADGAQVLVPREAAPGAPGSAPAPGVPGGPAGLVNVNTATEAELETLPGIGPVLAAAIVQYRTEHGPFTSVEQLEEVSGIGPGTLAEIRDLVTV